MREQQQRVLRWALSLVLLAAFVGTAKAPGLPLMSFADLKRKSDLIVIATPVATRQTDEETPLPAWRSVPTCPDSLQPQLRERAWTSRQVIGRGLETRFRISLCLKGHPDSSGVLVLHHYRVIDPGPITYSYKLSFDPEAHECYLMFLVRERDGRYAPTGGQTHPAVNGIHLLKGCENR
jgi:hypothetical protein